MMVVVMMGNKAKGKKRIFKKAMLNSDVIAAAFTQCKVAER